MRIKTSVLKVQSGLVFLPTKLLQPAQFKFTRGTWETEAIVEDTDVLSNLRIFPEKADHFEYVITNWKDKTK